MAKKALIVKGGWDGHEPNEVGALFLQISLRMKASRLKSLIRWTASMMRRR
ncbi:hypothetical protein ACFSQ7_15915 [Paenibacillus rhizoplanae]